MGQQVSVSTRVSGGGSWTPYSVGQGSVTESILSQCHKGTWPPPLDSDRDIGGELRLKRQWDAYTEVAPISAFKTRGVVGVSAMADYVFGVKPATAGTISELHAFGTSAIARCLPTNPNASLATALGELKKDGLPRLPGSAMRDQTDLARRSGNEYLNVEFGWLPLISDIQDFLTSVKRSRILIDQYVRDSDRKIRRRFEPGSIVHETEVKTGIIRVHGSNIVCPTGTVTKNTDERYWFSGAFKYHVPVGDDFYSRLRRYEQFADRLFGTRITPEVVWELAPWSWAVDWFTNAGDVIHNISRLGSDGLVMQYGYAMRHSRVDEFMRGSFSFSDSFGTHSGTVSRSVGTEWKQRVRAHPYGFGIDDFSLSARQWAILAALGLTRGRREG